MKTVIFNWFVVNPVTVLLKKSQARIINVFEQVVYYFDYRLHLIRGIPDISILPSFHRCDLVSFFGDKIAIAVPCRSSRVGIVFLNCQKMIIIFTKVTTLYCRSLGTFLKRSCLYCCLCLLMLLLYLSL